MIYDVHDYARSEKVFLSLAVALLFGHLHAETNGMRAFVFSQYVNCIRVTLYGSLDLDGTNQKDLNGDSAYVLHGGMNAHSKLVSINMPE